MTRTGAALVALSTTADLPVGLDRARALLLDWSRDAEWRSVDTMVVTPPGAAQVGQRIEEHLHVLGLPFVTPTRITEAGDRHAAYQGGSDWLEVRGSRRLTALSPSSCRFETDVEIRLRGPIRVLRPLLAAVYGRTDRRDVARLAGTVATL